MRQDYFEHYLRLVTGVAILSANRITEYEIQVAENLLNRFVRVIDHKYGPQFFSINIHLLLHFSNCVRKLNPL